MKLLHPGVCACAALLLGAGLTASGAASADPPKAKGLTLGKSKGGSKAAVAKTPGMTAISSGNEIRLLVPVQLSHMMLPEDRVPGINCAVRDANGIPLGGDTVLVPLSGDGSHSGNVTVTIMAEEGKALADARSYVCQLRLESKNPGDATYGVGPDHKTPWARAKEGTPFVRVVEGPLQPDQTQAPQKSGDGGAARVTPTTGGR